MGNDQAQKLRELVENVKQCETIFFMSGKEKVGQTVTLTNIATLLSENNYKTLILDSGSGFFRTDVMLNVFPKYGIRSVINNDQPLDDLIVPINDNLKIIYMRPIFEDIRTSEEVIVKLEKYLEKFKQEYDFILVDLEEADINSIKTILSSNTKILFTMSTNDLDCLKKTYSIIKDIETYTEIRDVNLIINKVKEKSVADDFYNRLKIASNKFLGVQVENIGYISNDAKVLESLRVQTPITNLYKDSEIYNEFKEVFSNIILD